MTKFHLSYAGYADHLNGQLGDSAFARPIPLVEGVLGYFLRDEPRLHAFHIEHFHSFGDWNALRELLGEEVTNHVHELHQEIASEELPQLSGLSEDELRAAMQQSVVRREFEVNWPDDSQTAARLRRIVDRWETGN
jgi:hypothetical protein